MASGEVAVGAPAAAGAGANAGGGAATRATMQLLSAAERDFVTRGVEQGVRPDGRERLASRSIHLELGVIPGAFGSAQAQCGGTKVVAAVKAEIVSPTAAQPGGRIEASVSCTLTASPLFEGQRGEEVAAELTMAMNRMLEGSLPEATRKALSISPEHCWLLLVDAVVLNHDGAVLDAVSCAAYAALADLKLPNVLVQKGKDGRGEIEMLENSQEVVTADLRVRVHARACAAVQMCVGAGGWAVTLRCMCVHVHVCVCVGGIRC